MILYIEILNKYLMKYLILLYYKKVEDVQVNKLSQI